MSALGDYTLEGELGRGAMGVVYRARHRPTGTLRAIKVLSETVDETKLARFRREAEALARIGGDAVVPVHEVGAEKGRAFFVMVHMPGGSLRARLDAEQRLEWREAAALGAALARALARCHAAGIVHRDLKPDNVLFDEQGRPRLADFGVARDLGGDSLTRTGTAVGTPHYMAPEQLEKGAASERADLYGLGVVLHELLTGELPHSGATPIELFQAKASGARRALPPGIPAALDAAIARALSPAPARRQASALELAAEIERVLERPGAPPRRAPRSGRLVVTALVIVLAVAAVVAAVALRESRPGGGAGDATDGGPDRPSSSGGGTGAHGPDSLDTTRRHLAETARALRSRDPLARASSRLALARQSCPSGRLPASEVADVISASLDRIVRVAEEAPRLTSRPLMGVACKEILGAFEIARSLGGASVRMPRSAAPLFHEHAGQIGLTAPGAPEMVELLLLATDADPSYAQELSMAAYEAARRRGGLHTDRERYALGRALAVAPPAVRPAVFEQAIAFERVCSRWDAMLKVALVAVRESQDHDTTLRVVDALLATRPGVRLDERLLDALATAAPGAPELLLPRGLLGVEHTQDVGRAFQVGFPDPAVRERVTSAVAQNTATARTASLTLVTLGRRDYASEILAKSSSPTLRALAARVSAATDRERREPIIAELEAFQPPR